MHPVRLPLAALLAAALLVACGGGDEPVPGSQPTAGAPTAKGSFSALVSFGDSLSDIGAYAPATSLAGNGNAPYFGGKFTTNLDGGQGKVWVENLASSLGLVVTPAEVGFAGSSVKCPAALQSAALAATCTGYGQGGSRVSDANGIGKSGGALTVPMTTQVANHLARFGSFSAADLVMVFGGNNDVFIQFGAFTAQATQIQTEAAAGRISADEAKRQLFHAQTTAQEALKTAALQLTTLVREQMLAKGARYVAVWNLPDSSLTPFGAALPASVKPVLTALVDTFNLWLREGLAGQPVQIVDANAALRDIHGNPAKYGMLNTTVPACDASKISVLTGGAISDGSSLFCSGTPGMPYTGLRSGADINTWQFADSVHPTVGGHKLISDLALATLRSYGWI
ncbi:MAG: SGNH/GDSL hydrolase family protein [Burkholderiaceae bacterium]|nr:SGNH/GDSL hydrolase family protein [Burkholderiaceae bacterium]